jgi:hypothetical protein
MTARFISATFAAATERLDASILPDLQPRRASRT